MASQFPAALDQLASDKGNATVSADDHPTHHNQLADAVNAIQAALGAGLSNVAASTDPRLSNARAPTAHKASHATGGSDALTPADIGAEPAGTSAAGMALHLAASDPHPQYTTTAEAAAAAPVQSVAGKTGAVTLTPADAGADPAGTASAAVAAHVAAADPHSQYTTAAEAAAAAPVQSVAGRTGAVTLAAADITDSTAAGRAVLTAADAAAQRTALGLVLGTDVQAYDADLQAIAALAGSSGLLRKTGANTWSLDTSSFLTGNQTVTVTGDASGSGATSIALTLANSGVAAGTYNDSATQVRPFTVDAKGRVTAVGAAVPITPAWAAITGKPTTLSGYGITDAQPLDADLTAIAALTHAADGFLVSNGSAWVRETPAEALVSLGLGTPTGTGNVVRATSPTVSDATLNGQTRLAAGTAAAPSLTTIGDTDTGVFFPSANTWAVATGAFERLRIDSSGNVGIGTTSPAVRLDVAEADITQIRAVATTNGVDTRLLSLGLSANAGVVGTYSNHPLVVYANSQERMRITSGGNVGIGTTDPLQPLHVIGSARFQGNIFNVNGFATVDFLESAAGVGFRWALNNNGTFRLQRSANGTYSDATTPILFDASGNVGIGTTSPTARLHVSGSGSQYVLAQTTDTTGSAIGYVGAQFGASTVLQMRAGLGYTYLLSTGASDPLLFGTNNQERMRITSGGNVVVGSTATIGGNMSVWGGLYLGANDSTAELQNYRASDNSGAAFSYLNKARGTIASPTVVQSGDGLGSMVWRGYDGATYAQAAIIRAEVDGTPGSGDMPGRLVFLTTLDGASTATERLRLKNGGQLRFVPLAADPGNAESGDVYYNSGTNKLRVYNGTTWVDLH